MPRRHLAVFSVFLIITVILLSLRKPNKLAIAAELSSVLLLPLNKVNNFLEYLTISHARIDQLENMLLLSQLENAELKTSLILDTTEFAGTPFVLTKAYIVARDPSNINGYLYINKGATNDLQVNQPVISPEGLVGKIVHVGSQRSIVETIENFGFAVSAVDNNSGIHGIVKNQRALIFDYIRIGDSVLVDDSVYTSGMSEQFPEGILIGTVEKVDDPADIFFKPVYITPSVHVNRLTCVYIIGGHTTDAYIRKILDSPTRGRDNAMKQE